MSDMSLIPGTRVMLVYTDHHGTDRSTLVEVVAGNHENIGKEWQAIKARREIFGCVFNITPLNFSNFDVEEGWAISMVSKHRLKPLGTRIFHIVQ